MYGKPITYFVANGMSELRFPDSISVSSEMSSMDGQEQHVDLSFSNAIGDRTRSRRPIIRRKGKNPTGKRLAPRQRTKQGSFGSGFRRLVDNITDPETRAKKMALKEQQIAVQKSIADNMGKTSPEEAALIQRLSNPSNISAPTNSGMSKGMKTGLIVGGIAVVAIIGFVVYKKYKSNKNK